MYKNEGQVTVFEESLQVAIKKARASVKYLRALTTVFHVLIIGLAAASTIVLGMNYNVSCQQCLVTAKNTALILGAVITLLSALKAAWNLDGYWIRRKLYYFQLKEIRDEFFFYKALTRNITLKIFSKNIRRLESSILRTGKMCTTTYRFSNLVKSRIDNIKNANKNSIFWMDT